MVTAIEDFMDEQEGLRFAIIPLFFGCGLLWPESAPWADEIAEIVDPYDRNPILERVEKARVIQLIRRHSREQEIDDRFEYSRKLQHYVTRLADSRALGPLEWASRLRRGGKPCVLPRGVPPAARRERRLLLISLISRPRQRRAAVD